MAEMVRHKILFPGRDCILELLAAVFRLLRLKPGAQASLGSGSAALRPAADVVFVTQRADHLLFPTNGLT